MFSRFNIRDAQARLVCRRPVVWTSLAAMLLLGAGGLSGCDAAGQGDAGQAVQAQDAAHSARQSGIIWTPAVRLLQPQQVRDLQVAPDHIVVSRAAGDDLRRFQPGDVLVAQDGQGFWRTITEVDARGPQLIYHTRHAQVQEAVEAGEFLILSEDALRDESSALAQFDQRRQGIDLGGLLGGLDLEPTFAKSFDLNKRLDSESRVQIAQHDVSLTTGGHLKMKPGFKLYARIAEMTLQEFEVTVFGEVDLKMDMTLKVKEPSNPGAVQPFAFADTIPLCSASGAGFDCEHGRPTISVSLLGKTVRLYPQLSAAFGWQGRGGGTVKTGFQGSGYVKAGYHYVRGGDSRPVFTKGFEAEPIEIVMEDGNVEVDLQAQVDLSLVAESGGTKWVEATPLAGAFALHAATAPPLCQLRSSLNVLGRVKYDFFNLRGNRLLYNEKLLDHTGSISDIPGCQLDTTNQAERCGGGAGQCGANFECIAGFCVEQTPLQISLNWSAPVNLNLVVENPYGELLVPSSSGDNQDGDVGWVAVSSAGPLAGEEAPMVNSYSEIALFRSVRDMGTYRYWVVNASDEAAAAPIRYSLTLHHQETGDQLITGKLSPEPQSESPRFVWVNEVHD